MTTNTRYMGWTSYATWLVYLEIFEGREGDLPGDITAGIVEELALDILDAGRAAGSRRLRFVQPFIADVNWHEIAAHVHEQSDEVQTALNIKKADDDWEAMDAAMDAWLDAPEETKEPES